MVFDQTLDVGIALDDFPRLHQGLVDHVIDRSNVTIPGTFASSATQFSIADDAGILYLAHPMGMYGISPRWHWFGGARKNLFETYDFHDHHWFSLRGCGCTLPGYKKLWAIGRQPSRKSNIQDVLTLHSKPIFFTYLPIAKVVAQLCHPNPREEAKCLRWVPIDA
jgi:hypothetical protein